MADPVDPEVFLPPTCPDCIFKMRFVTVDMAGQGGPPEHTWLCSNPACGRALGSYVPEHDERVCIP